ncbi:MAG: lasso peptide biosynthesis B2 protein [Chloroflexota bacterium]
MHTLARKWRTFRSLTRPERWLVLRAWPLLLSIDLGLRLLPFRRLQSLLAIPPRAPAPPNPQPAIRLTLNAIDRAARNHLYPMTCLRRALALQRLLAQQGIPTDLRFGARLENGALAAHAWLEHHGQPVGEALPLEKRFTPLASAAVRAASSIDS